MLGYAQSTDEDHIPNTLKYIDKALSYMKNPNKKFAEKDNLNPLKKITQQRDQYSRKNVKCSQKRSIKGDIPLQSNNIQERNQYSGKNVKCSQKKSIKKRDIPLLPKPTENEMNMCRDILNGNKRTSYVHTGVDHTYFQHT